MWKLDVNREARCGLAPINAADYGYRQQRGRDIQQIANQGNDVDDFRGDFLFEGYAEINLTDDVRRQPETPPERKK